LLGQILPKDRTSYLLHVRGQKPESRSKTSTNFTPYVIRDLSENILEVSLWKEFVSMHVAAATAGSLPNPE